MNYSEMHTANSWNICACHLNLRSIIKHFFYESVMFHFLISFTPKIRSVTPAHMWPGKHTGRRCLRAVERWPFNLRALWAWNISWIILGAKWKFMFIQLNVMLPDDFPAWQLHLTSIVSLVSAWITGFPRCSAAMEMLSLSVEISLGILHPRRNYCCIHTRHNTSFSVGMR